MWRQPERRQALWVGLVTWLAGWQKLRPIPPEVGRPGGAGIR
jgi:hypothetical protein